MTRLLLATVLVVLSIPLFAFAAYNDVTLTTSAVISVGGYTLNVAGSSAVIQSIVISTNSFSVTLASGSSFTVSSPTLNRLSSDITTDVSGNPCTGSTSSITLAYSGASTVTNVITPSATTCSGSSSSSISSPAGGNGPVVGSGPLAPGYVNNPPTLAASVTGTAASAPPSPTQVALSSSRIVITRNYQLWDISPDILALQQWLNANRFPVASSGPGSSGHETLFFGFKTYRALIEFQKAHRLPATGYLGPLTRALIATFASQ